MKEQGMIIFEDGSVLSFGKYVCPDDEKYLSNPTHEMTFAYEVVPSLEFRNSDHYYIDECSLYQNVLRLSLEGLITILNKQQGLEKPTEIMAFMPDNPTKEQIESIINNKQLMETEIQDINTFNSYDFNDYKKYQDLKSYIQEKNVKKEK